MAAIYRVFLRAAYLQQKRTVKVNSMELDTQVRDGQSEAAILLEEGVASINMSVVANDASFAPPRRSSGMGDDEDDLDEDFDEDLDEDLDVIEDDEDEEDDLADDDFEDIESLEELDELEEIEESDESDDDDIFADLEDDEDEEDDDELLWDDEDEDDEEDEDDDDL